MRFAYADPPYLGCCGQYGHEHGDGGCWNDVATHRALIASLDGFDGWALSCSSTSLRELLAVCPADVRVGAWVKSFAAYNPNINPAYAWEPVIFRPLARLIPRTEPTIRDWVSARITFERGTPGAKPEEFCSWLFAAVRLRESDEFVDFFPGSGAVSRAWESWRSQIGWRQWAAESVTA